MRVCVCVCGWLAGREWVVVMGVWYMAPLSKGPEGGLQLWVNVWYKDSECVCDCVWVWDCQREGNIKRQPQKCVSLLRLCNRFKRGYIYYTSLFVCVFLLSPATFSPLWEVCVIGDVTPTGGFLPFFNIFPWPRAWGFLSSPFPPSSPSPCVRVFFHLLADSDLRLPVS